MKLRIAVLCLAVLSTAFAPMADATIHPSKGEKQAFAAGVVVGALFQGPLRTAAVKTAKAGARTAKHVGRVITLRAK